MFGIYLLFAILIAGSAFLLKKRSVVRALSYLFFGGQLVFAGLVPFHLDYIEWQLFEFDMLGTVCFVLMSVIALVAFYQSNFYLDYESDHEYKTYNVCLMLLCAAAAGVYFSANLAVTWVFLEATTLCTAGLIYHRRDGRSLEATWKYIFVCSIGIAIAYMGLLLISSMSVDGNVSYTALRQVMATANPLFLKLAFLFILVGYSCKMEVFPLYTIGVDANYAAPTPACAIISTVLVNAGFVSVFRVYKLIALSPIYSWACNVLIIAGLFSILIGAVYLRRTNSYKRFFSYSTVENMGIVLVGLGVGKIGVFAAVLHVIFHALVKAGMFFNLAQIGKIYGSYRINRIGNYIAVNKLGAVSILLGFVGLLALPPSALFLSEMIIFQEIIADLKWWLLVVLLLLLCFVMYSLAYRLLRLCYRPVKMPDEIYPVSKTVTFSGFVLIVAVVVAGIVQPSFLLEIINTIIAF